MKRKTSKQHTSRSRPLPRPAVFDATAAAPADVPEREGVEQAQQQALAEVARTARTSIERADEHRLGSIETVPAQAPENHIAGFVEPAGDERADEALPPPLPSQ
jgi:hypothetical protein